MSWLTHQEIAAWNQGCFFESYRKLGSHPNRGGTWFAVWAPYADYVSVVGDFNDWDGSRNPLRPVGFPPARFWQGFVRQAREGHRYKFHVRRWPHVADKSDPYGFEMEPPVESGSATAGLSSIIRSSEFKWTDKKWMSRRRGPGTLDGPVSIYEVHVGSWRRGKDGSILSYREIARPLIDYLREMGYTHVEFMPLLEHPFYGSWGYQVAGYYAPTHRYGSPEDLKFLINGLHRAGIGVLLDWVPAHFATDPQGLSFFDGSTLYEYDDPVMRHHPDWGTFVFDYNKPGVRNFLISNALYWLDEYHVDGLRFDAVASMLYRDYSRDDWTPNIYGGRENLEAVYFLKSINEIVFERFPEAIMVAEESTAWPAVSKPTKDQGLGFLYKWNLGWMHDTLKFMQGDPDERKHHFNELTFPLVYAFSEHYTLPLSHDEVVHGKGSLWDKMPGEEWEKAANLRLLLAHMYGHPGKKLLFMGGEFGQRREWSHDRELDWGQLDDPQHAGIRAWVRDLNFLYREQSPLWNDEREAFEWIDFSDTDNSVVSYLRLSEGRCVVFVFNFTPVPRVRYRVGLREGGTWRILLNSDSSQYGGSDTGSIGALEAEHRTTHWRPFSVDLDLPPLGVLILVQEEENGASE
ncbi:MAG: 1,4-alpha-glucan branching protein GlgB [Bacteroidetes bacterium]|nr:1,4-alpha-glucan branching protein GlgB [Bacteroidota bacterium]